MPSSSTAQRNYIFYLRGRYKTKDKTPEKDKWIWEKSWEEIKESINEDQSPFSNGKGLKGDFQEQKEEMKFKRYKRYFSK